MKAITLTQPWATLVALKKKRIETRSWSTQHRGPLAIHAAKGFPPGLRMGQTLRVGGFTVERDKSGLLLRGNHELWPWPYRLPMGAVVATAELVEVHQITEESLGWMDSFLRIVVHREEWLIEPERDFGDYTPGRYAWLLSSIEPLHPPVEAKGALGLWDWDEAA